jgi:NDP-sugar pyrophosphorylase family protein
MELTVEQLRLAGIHRVNVATHYLADQIVGHFGDGQEFGVQIDYLREDEPLGTAGALRLLPAGDEPLLVINGDVLTRVDFRALLAFHREQRAELTVGVRAYEIEVPYGVVHCQGARVTRLEEKPHYQFLVNAGIYLLEPEVQAAIPEGRRFDMTDLIEGLIDQGRSVVSFPIVEYWLDIGRLADYERANEDMNRGDLQR